MATGGDLIEITYNNPTLGSGRLDPKGSEDTEVDFGGYMTQDSDDSVSGSGVNIIIKNRKRWSITSPPLLWNSNPDTLEVLQNLQDDNNQTTFTFTFIDGSVYKGLGTIVGDLKGNKNAATINSVKFAGGGKLELIG